MSLVGKLKDRVTVKDTLLTVGNICRAINEFNTENSVDVICIVRGGGDPESLLCFSHPDLVRTVANSAIPIVTGIGHMDDYSLCEMVADENAGTPSNAARCISRLFWQSRRPKETSPKIKATAKETIDWKEQYLRAKEQIAELEQRIEELTQALQEAQKPRGFFSRIFGGK